MEEILNLWDCNKITCGEALEMAYRKGKADAIDEFIERARDIKFASIDGREIFLERVHKIARQLKEQNK